MTAWFLSEEVSKSGLYKLDFQAWPAASDSMATADMACIYNPRVIQLIRLPEALAAEGGHKSQVGGDYGKTDIQNR